MTPFNGGILRGMEVVYPSSLISFEIESSNLSPATTYPCFLMHIAQAVVPNSLIRLGHFYFIVLSFRANVKKERRFHNIMFIYANSNQISPYVKRYIVDTEAEIPELPTNGAPGSTAFIIDISKVYILNNQKEWVEAPGLSGGGGFDPTATYGIDGNAPWGKGVN